MVLVLVANDAENRPEDLFAGDRHILRIAKTVGFTK